MHRNLILGTAQWVSRLYDDLLFEKVTENKVI